MKAAVDEFGESAEDLYEDAPCGYLSTRLDGAIIKVNRTFENWTGLKRTELLGGKRFQDLLPPGGRIYHETHFAPLLQMQGSVREIAVEIVRADGSRLPALVNSDVISDSTGTAQIVRTTVFDASDRRRYELELLEARREQHQIAVELQAGLLSKDLPDVEGLEVEVAYRPARSGTEVGGDWYDAFWGDEEDLLARVVVGDVVGKGIVAAAQMGQLRSAVRAFAAAGLGPARLLEALDRYSARHDVGQLATLAFAEVDTRAECLRFACAGHLPPLVVQPGAAPEFVWAGRSLPLTMAGSPAPDRTEATLPFPPGSTLVLYTDGLIERRGESLDAGMERLRAAVDASRDEHPADLANELIRALEDPDDHDDVCILIARAGQSA